MRYVANIKVTVLHLAVVFCFPMDGSLYVKYLVKSAPNKLSSNSLQGVHTAQISRGATHHSSIGWGVLAGGGIEELVRPQKCTWQRCTFGVDVVWG